MWYSSSTNRPFNIGNASSSSAPWAGFSSTAATINVPVTVKGNLSETLQVWGTDTSTQIAFGRISATAQGWGYIGADGNAAFRVWSGGTAATPTRAASNIFEITPAGAVTLGPSAGGVNHTINGGLLLPSSGATASALNFYATTTFTFAWTPNGSGSTASSNVTAVLTRIGNLVSLTIPDSADAVPAGTTAYLSYSSLPAWARPSTTRSAGGVFPVRNNATMAYTGAIEVDSSGVIYLFRDQASTAFTNAAGAGAPRISLTWLI
jgi:hypothetical protein